MRDYAKIIPTFWTGRTGKALRARGSEALIVGMYLMSSPHSNMLGLFYQPILYMAHETGLGEEGARKGLAGACEAGFCKFDEATEMVWVHEMAAYQIASELKATDNRCAGIQKDYDALPDNPFLAAFFDKYQHAFHLTKRRGYPSPLQDPPKPRTGTGAGEGAGDLLPPPPAPPAPPAPPPSPVPPADPKGSRLPNDWALPPEWAQWCTENRPDLDPQGVADGFRDFWVGKAGKDGRKADWLATWRNWCRGQKPGTGPRRGDSESFV